MNTFNMSRREKVKKTRQMLNEMVNPPSLIRWAIKQRMAGKKLPEFVTDDARGAADAIMAVIKEMSPKGAYGIVNGKIKYIRDCDREAYRARKAKADMIERSQRV